MYGINTWSKTVAGMNFNTQVAYLTRFKCYISSSKAEL